MAKSAGSEAVSEVASGPDQRREQMLRAAVEVICERGFSDTRISDVAQRAEASPALVIYYFGTKDGLLTEAMRWSEDEFYRHTETDARPADHRARAVADARQPDLRPPA